MGRREETPDPPRTTQAFRLGDDERRLVQAAAAVRRESMSGFIRRVALAAARRELADGSAQ
jgi:uncharacterized protein (DUF1778 family)